MERVPEDWGRALAVAAHPDDLEYGASAAIARWTAGGRTITQLLATRGEAGIDGMRPEDAARLRTQEQIAASRCAGVEVVEFLDHPDGVLEYGLPLRRDIAAAIRRHRPDVVISLNFRESWASGPGFNMADHRALGLAVADAVRDAGNRWVFPELGLEPWSRVRFTLFANSPQSTHYVDVTDHLAAGIASLEAHRMYLDSVDPGFDPKEWLTQRTARMGAPLGVSHAMPFELLTL